MFGFRLVFAVLLAVPSLAIAQRTDPPKYWLTIVTPANERADSESGKLLKWLSAPTEPALVEWCRKAKVGAKRINDPVAKDRWGFLRPDELPAVFLQREDGGVVYKATRANLPSDEYSLARELDFYDKLGGGARQYQSPDSQTQVPITWVPQSSSDCPDGKCPWDTPNARPRPPRFPEWPQIPDSVDVTVDAGKVLSEWAPVGVALAVLLVCAVVVSLRK